jgi:phospholipid/cholesterol/gamma-HCH transport system ATP-binding protein
MNQPNRPLRQASYANEPIVRVSNLSKSFGERNVLDGVSFDVWAGEMLGIIGPSGCGKSTILKLLCGLIEPDGGTISKQADDIGLVFQGSALLNSLTVRQNLSLALRSKRLSKKEENDKINATLELVGLSNYLHAYPSQLSGGQQKRVSFARATVYDPKIILYDEPTTGLDPVMSTIIEDYMIQLEDRVQAASIVVTHQYSTWKRTTDRVILLNAGKIVWTGKPEEAGTTDNPFVRQFVDATTNGPMTTN